MTDWFMGHWAASPTSSSSPFIYLTLAIFSIFLVFARSALILILGVRCSTKLHHNIFHKVLYAPVNTFFDVTPIGRILNRFLSDLDQVDGQLPFLGIITLQCLFQVGSILLICGITSPLILMLFAPLVVGFYKIQVFYNKTSNELKRLDSITRSPVLNLINETFHGFSTIRVFQSTQAFATKHTQLLDHNQSFYLTYRVASRWMQMRLDWISSLIIAGVAFLTVVTKDSIGIVAAGLSLTYASQLSSTLSNLTSTYANVETIMTSVERLDYFNSLPTEGGSIQPSFTPPSSWPMQGMIQFQNFSMRYRPHLTYALKNVSFTIQSGQKVGICGRTGSGK
ncbi:ATP-binding Cassette (ABC) Superfamily, partial [Thraustotheca clavata]